MDCMTFNSPSGHSLLDAAARSGMTTRNVPRHCQMWGVGNGDRSWGIASDWEPLTVTRTATQKHNENHKCKQHGQY